MTAKTELNDMELNTVSGGHREGGEGRRREWDRDGDGRRNDHDWDDRGRGGWRFRGPIELR